MIPLLLVEHLFKSFGGLQAIDDLNLTVSRGDLTGIIGPNGAGKTTFFNIITGFIRSDSGRVIFKERDVTRAKPFQIVNFGISRTFQLVELFKSMTVLENVMVPCFSRRAKDLRSQGEKVADFAMGILDEVGLGNRWREPAESLSFGELRLLDIGRAMVTKPDVLLLDEPFSGLDVGDAAVLSKAILRMHSQGLTIIIIEHRLKDLLNLVKNVIAIVFGKKVAEGSPEEIVRDEKVIVAYLGEKRE